MKLLGLMVSVALLGAAVGVVAEEPCRKMGAGEVHVEHFASGVFPDPQSLHVWTPPGYGDVSNAARQYPVLYLFDGQNLFSGCAAAGEKTWRIDETLGALIEQKKVEPMIVVGIDAPDDGPKRASEFLAVGDTIGPYKFEPHGDRLPRFFSTEVMPRVERAYRVRKGRGSTAVGGSSYGGVAALYVLMTMPDEVGLGLIESPSGSPGNGEIARWTRDWYVTPVRISIGVGDSESRLFREMVAQLGIDPDENDRSFVRVTRAVAENFKAAMGDARVRFVVAHGGAHNEEDWARRFPEAVGFLFPGR